MKAILKRSLALGLCLALCLSALACAQEKSPEEYSGEITIWSWSESEVETLAANFNKVYPNVKINYVPIDNGDVTLKLQMAAASGSEMPDIAYLERNTRGKLLAMDIWEDLSAEPYGFDRSLVFEPLLSQMTNDKGEICCIDREYNPSGFVYNRALAKQYLGTDDADEVWAMIDTWDKLIETGKKVAEASNGTVFTLGGLDDINWMMSNQYAETIFDGNTAHLSAYFTYMLDTMCKIRDANIAGVMKRWTPAWNASYYEGNVLFYEYAPWSANAALKANDTDSVGNWTVIRAPGGAYTMGGTAYGIPRAAKNKDLAWLFINWTLLTQEGTQACVDSFGVIGVLKSFYENMADVSDPYFAGQDVNKFLMTEVAPSMVLRPVNQYDGVLDDVMGLMLDKLYDNPDMDCAAAVQVAIEECRSMLPADMQID